MYRSNSFLSFDFVVDFDKFASCTSLMIASSFSFISNCRFHDCSWCSNCVRASGSIWLGALRKFHPLLPSETSEYTEDLSERRCSWSLVSVPWFLIDSSWSALAFSKMKCRNCTDSEVLGTMVMIVQILWSLEIRLYYIMWAICFDRISWENSSQYAIDNNTLQGPGRRKVIMYYCSNYN